LAPILNELPKQADFVVVGGGLTGGSAAYHLAKSLQGTGKTIALIEARELSGGATGRNGGICVPAKEYSWAIAGDLAQGLPLNTDHLAAKNKWELANADALVAFHEEWRQKNPESPVFLERWPDGCIETWVTKKEADTGIMVHKLMEEAGLNVSEDGGRRWEVWSSDEAERRTGIKGVFGAVVYYVAFRVWGAKVGGLNVCCVLSLSHELFMSTVRQCRMH
jgi:glycine/D-amino acid oxidase-like deaminating enzyme